MHPLSPGAASDSMNIYSNRWTHHTTGRLSLHIKLNQSKTWEQESKSENLHSGLGSMSNSLPSSEGQKIHTYIRAFYLASSYHILYWRCPLLISPGLHMLVGPPFSLSKACRQNWDVPRNTALFLRPYHNTEHTCCNCFSKSSVIDLSNIAKLVLS